MRVTCNALWQTAAGDIEPKAESRPPCRHAVILQEHVMREVEDGRPPSLESPRVPYGAGRFTASLRDGPLGRTRFDDDGQLATHVPHGNVCRLHDLFHVDHSGEPSVTMELLTGLRGCRGRPACRRYRRRHRAGVAHRDLKPANVILVASESGVVAIACADSRRP